MQDCSNIVTHLFPVKRDRRITQCTILFAHRGAPHTDIVTFAVAGTFIVFCDYLYSIFQRSIQAMAYMLCAKRSAKFFLRFEERFFGLTFLANSSFWKREEIQDGGRTVK